ncbi:MAG TPA: endonuclease III [Bacillota bacterium]
MAILSELYPQPKTELKHRNPFELLIATMLSAQSTDAMVNRVTPALFARCPTPEAFLELDVAELEQMIRTLGLYRSKARNILKACRVLVERFGGEVPRTREELMQLPGVGRKTANVVLSNAFGEPAIAVDTHVFRVANRLGLAQADDVREVEEQLMRRIPREQWRDAHHWLILHGRRCCHARNPRCQECPLAHLCASSPRRREAAGAAKGKGVDA